MQTRKWLTALLAAGVLTAAGWIIFNSNQPPPAPTLPSPNGYEDFVKAGQLLVGELSDYRTANHEELRTFVTENAEALKLAQTGLSRECRVPIVYSQTYMGRHLSELTSIRKLAQALNAEGRLAELERRNREAVEAHLATMRLGQEAMRGGVLIDGLIGIACEAIGSGGLKNMVTNLNASECREVIDALGAIEKKQVSFEQVMKDEREWSRRSFPFHQRIFASLMRFFNVAAIKQAEQKAALKFQTQEKRRRELLIDVAARAYELEKGQRPKRIEELVPDYLKAIPIDPVTRTNMVYRP